MLQPTILDISRGEGIVTEIINNISSWLEAGGMVTSRANKLEDLISTQTLWEYLWHRVEAYQEYC